MTKLTHVEHDARAMLMGMKYDWRDGTYFDLPPDHRPVPYLDAMTLQEVTRDEAYHRMHRWGFTDGDYMLKVRPPTPYAYAENQDAHT